MPAVDVRRARRRTPFSTFWQNEDMDVDRKRKLVLLSRDPRAYAGSTIRDPGSPDPNGRRTSRGSTSSTRRTWSG
jgi:hypothetical protein